MRTLWGRNYWQERAFHFAYFFTESVIRSLYFVFTGKLTGKNFR